jgi:hypothetical protein
MHLKKSHKIAAVIILIAAFLVAENTLLRPASVSRYNGVQIYDAIRDFRSLEHRGFDVTVRVEGTSNDKPVQLTGSIVETYAGWFILNSEGAYRIVEGPMGSKDVLANLIYFDVSPTLSVEAVFEPETMTKFSLKEGFRKVRGSIAFDASSISPTLFQDIRNLNQEFYSLTPNRIEVTQIGSGFVLDIKVPVRISEINELVSKIDSGEVRTGYMYYYKGADDENDIPEIRQDLEGKGAVLVNYYKQR